VNILGKIILPIILVYVTVRFGEIVAKHGKNPFLFGILPISTPMNLIILGYWAFSGTKKERQ